jgi:signal transduction histidine kinase
VSRSRPIRLGLRSGLLLAFLLPALTLWTAAAVVGHQRTHALLQTQLDHALSALAATAASQVRGERLALVQEGDDAEGLRTWSRLAAQLEGLRAAGGLRRVLVVDRQGRARGDTGRHESGRAPFDRIPVGAQVPELTQDTLELAEVWAGRATTSEVPFRGLDGRDYLRGYAPIRDDTGEIVGALCVEGSADFFRPLRRLALWTLLWGLLAALALVIAALAVAAVLGRPFVRLRDTAQRIGRGDLSTPVVVEGGLQEVADVAVSLEAMRQALESRDRQLKMMLAGVAHEVKNPLGGMELFGGLLAEELGEGGSEEARSHLARIRGEVTYLGRIVEDFLAFAREQRLNVAPFEAAGWLDRAGSLLEGEARGRGVHLEVVAAPARLTGDEGLLTAAVVNLVKNAVQASSHGQTVRLRGEGEGDRYVVRIQDSGPGIPEEVQGRIFEPFFTTREQGTGLGLALARKLVEAHGGTLTVESRPLDTCFEVALPLASIWTRNSGPTSTDNQGGSRTPAPGVLP